MTSKEYNEEIIIEELRNEDTRQRAFNKVMRHYSQPLYWQIRRMVIDHENTNDILQETFIKAWININHFRGDAKLSTWLYKIAINESITFLNKERNKQTTSIDDEDSFLINNLQADDWFDGNDLQLELQKAINRLPEKQRLVFNMRYYDELSFEEISQATGQSVSTLKTNYHYAVQKIKEQVRVIEIE